MTTFVDNKLNEKVMNVIRIAWYLLMIISIGLMIFSIPGYLSGFPFLVDQNLQASSVAIKTASIISIIASIGGALLSLGMAALLFIRKPHDRMALFTSFYLILYAMLMTGVLEAFLFYWEYSPSIAIDIQTIFTTVPTVILLCTFPNGRFVPHWTRWLMVGSILIVFAIFLRTDENWATFSSPYTQVTGIILGVMLILAVVAQIYRYRKVSTLIEREQAKWVIVGLFAWVLYMAISSIPYILVQNLPTDRPLPWWVPITSVSWWLSLMILPISLSIAILRSRLFDIDLIIRKTLIYGAITVSLGLVYFGSVVLLQSLFTALGGQRSPVAIVISTLVIAALFNPLRTRIQRTIDRRFYRSKFDAEKTLAYFAQSARDETDLDALTGDLVKVIKETMQLDRVDIWLAKEEKKV